jgi:hypothetical protein
LAKTRDDFLDLEESSWQDIGKRESISRAATSFEQYNGDVSELNVTSEDYEAPWSVLQAISMDMTYLTRTTFNLFSLIRLGNVFAKSEQVCVSL